jgi:signal transduction histidine kinase
MPNSVEVISHYTKPTIGRMYGKSLLTPQTENRLRYTASRMFRESVNKYATPEKVNGRFSGKGGQYATVVMESPEDSHNITGAEAHYEHAFADQLEALNCPQDGAALQNSLTVFSLFAHQLLTYMTYIELTVDTLLLTQEQASHQQKDAHEEDLQFIRNQVEHSADVLKRGLSLTHLLREGSFQLEPIALSPTVSEIAKRFQAQYKNREISVMLATEGIIWGSQLLLELILENLIQNALLHAGADSAVTIAIEAKGEEILVRVMDNGCGMSEEQLQKLFNPLEQRISSDTKKKSNGVGLFLTKLAVEMQGGQIWVKSQPSQGTHFYITLKRCVA